MFRKQARLIAIDSYVQVCVSVCVFRIPSLHYNICIISVYLFYKVTACDSATQIISKDAGSKTNCKSGRFINIGDADKRAVKPARNTSSGAVVGSDDCVIMYTPLPICANVATIAGNTHLSMFGHVNLNVPAST